MFYKGEIEEDLRDVKYPSRSEWLMFREGDLDTFMKKIVEERSTEMYDHHQSKDCPARGTYINTFNCICNNMSFTPVLFSCQYAFTANYKY